MALRRVYKITTFVPPEHLDSLLVGIERIVPLIYGRYDHSAWWSAVGVEQFQPMPGSTPSIGTIGHLERVPSIRVEFAIPHDPELLDLVLLHGLMPNHPWQEPAVFVDESLATATEMVEARDLP